jgi:hypothetical protein
VLVVVVVVVVAFGVRTLEDAGEGGRVSTLPLKNGRLLLLGGGVQVEYSFHGL